MYRYDKMELTEKPERTPQGYLRVKAGISRADCVLTYRTSNGVIKEFRPKEEVFSEESKKSARSLPIIVGSHVPKVDLDNTNQLVVGHSSDVVEERADLLESDLVFTNKRIIQDIEDGKYKALSPGYSLREVDRTPGINKSERYDQIQRGITYNHLLLLPAGKGRQGDSVGLRLDSDDAIYDDEKNIVINGDQRMKTKIRLDGKEIEVDVSNESEAKIVEDLSTRYDSTNKELQTVRGELDETKRKLESEKQRADKAEDTDSINQAVNERIVILTTLRRFDSKIEFKNLDKKSNHELRLDALEKVGRTRADYENESEEYVRGAFNAIELPKETVKRVIGAPIPQTQRHDQEEEVINPKLEMNKHYENAWKGTK